MDIRSVDLNLLVILDALLHQQSVSRAAAQLNMSQSAVSFALAKLRKLFADPLLVRAARQMQLTPRAMQLTEPLHGVLDSIRNDLLQPSGFDAATAQRTIAIALSDVGELVFLPRTVAFLRRNAPGIHLRSVATQPDELERALQSGDLDLAIGYFPGLKAASIYQQRLFSHTFVCIVRIGHPVVGDELTRQAFLGAQHAIVEGESNAAFEHALEERGIARPIVLTLPHYLAIPAILSESDLVVTVPYAVGASFTRMGGLRILRPPIDVQTPHVKQYWHTRFNDEPASKWLRGVIAELFLEAPRAPGSRKPPVKDER